MAVFRVERNTGYTVMSNHHLRNKELSLKAKGLLSQMLSLPEDWDYTLAGLSYINREKIDAIREAVRELERAGYIQRSRERDEKGRLRGTDYIIYEQPPNLDLPTLENPTLENPTQEKPTLENPMQLNKDIQKTDLSKKEKSNTDLSNNHSIPILSPNPSPLREETAEPPERKRKEAADAYRVYEEIIKDNIEYEHFIKHTDIDRERLDEIVSLTSNAYYAADYIKAIAPLTGEKPTELQRAHIRQQKVAAQEQPTQEQPEQEAPQDKDTFSIYQIKGGDETRDLRFEPYDRLTATGHRVDAKNYALVYSAELTPGTSLEDIYTRFNIDHPKDFKGHSLSVSDIVVLHQNGQDTAHYVDSFGYKEVPEFFKEQEKALIPDELETGETIKTPRGTFYVTAMSREQMEAAGYGLHHQSDDGKYLIMGNGTRAFAIAAEQPENYLKTAEQTTEQNYNMIDGQINNTPTAAELEEKAKAGGQISLAEYAEALKAEKKQTEPEKKPSIRAQLRADKEKTAQKKRQNQKITNWRYEHD